MNLVDSCGWLEYFADGENAEFFAIPLQDTKNLIVPSICIFEVFKNEDLPQLIVQIEKLMVDCNNNSIL